MAREKPYYREIVADLAERSGGKMMFTCKSIKDLLKIGQSKAIDMLEGKKEISIYELARKIIG
jgi:hypothetical protein